MFLALNISFPRLEVIVTRLIQRGKSLYRDLRIDHILSRLARQISAHCFVDHFFKRPLDLPNQHSPMSCRKDTKKRFSGLAYFYANNSSNAQGCKQGQIGNGAMITYLNVLVPSSSNHSTRTPIILFQACKTKEFQVSKQFQNSFKQLLFKMEALLQGFLNLP